MRTMEKGARLIDVFRGFWEVDEPEISTDVIDTAQCLTPEEKALLKESSYIDELKKELQTHEIEKRKKPKKEIGSTKKKSELKEKENAKMKEQQIGQDIGLEK